jgi:hypothetical protein
MIPGFAFEQSPNRRGPSGAYTSYGKRMHDSTEKGQPRGEDWYIWGCEDFDQETCAEMGKNDEPPAIRRTAGTAALAGE